MSTEPPTQPKRATGWPSEAAWIALTLGIGAVGGLAFLAVGVPAALLTGSAVAIALCVLAGVPLRLPDRVRAPAFSVLGMLMGSSITPEALEQLAAVPLALIGLAILVFSATAVSFVVLRRVGGWDPLSALCGSIPGSMALVLAVSLESGARMDRVIMSQSIRLFILVTLIPFVLGGEEASAMRVAAGPFTPLEIVSTLALTAAAAGAATLLRVPAPMIIGPLVGGAVLSGSGLATIAVPPWMAAFAFLMVGASVALRFKHVRREGLWRLLVASFASFVAATLVALVVSAVFAMLLEVPLGAAFLAFAPGGLDAMIALSFLLHYDVAFTAIIHTARLILLGLTVPVMVSALARRWRRRGEVDPEPTDI